MRINKLFVCILSVLSMLVAGCSKNSDRTLCETKLIIPTYTISAPAKGKILGLILEKGEHIGKGQPLFAIASAIVDQNVKTTSEQVAKAEAKLKKLEIGSAIQIDESEIAAARNRVDRAINNVNKMNSLFAAGAVSKKQAQQAERELDSAKADLSALIEQTERQKASPEEIEKQKKALEEVKIRNVKALEKQAAFEAFAPSSCVVMEKFANNGDEVEKDQAVLNLLAQDECETKIKLNSKEIEKVNAGKKDLVFRAKERDMVFTGKVITVKDDTITVLVKLPSGLTKDINVWVEFQE